MSTSYFALRHPVVRVQRTSDISSVYDLTTADPHWWIGALTMEALGILADRTGLTRRSVQQRLHVLGLRAHPTETQKRSRFGA